MTDFLEVEHSGVKIRRRRKVALVGFASSTKDMAPFTDDTFDIWGMNDIYRVVSRWDRLFEMHERERIRMDKVRGVVVADGGDHWKYLAALPGPGDPKFCPVYTQERFEDMPASVKFPREELAAYFNLEYATSTPAYMMALAIMDGFEEIHLYGIDLLTNEEYEYQRPCLEYWIGVAQGRGIKVVVPKQSALLKANYVYGYSYPPDPGQYAPIKAWIKEQTTKLEASKLEVEASFIRVEAVLRAAETFVGKFKALKASDPTKTQELAGEMLTTLETDRARLVAQRDELNRAHGAAAGSVQTANAFLSWMEHYERGGALQT